MKQFSLLFLLVTYFHTVYAQPENYQVKFDSIIAEADLLYRYEKAVWHSTDLLVTEQKLMDNYGGYIVMHSKDSVFVTYLDKSFKESIARYTFSNQNLNTPASFKLKTSKLSKAEKELFDIKVKMAEQLSDSKYEVTIPNGYSPNLILFKEKDMFKLYIIMGTAENGVIPFGNDYLFWADSNGNITNWKKFHTIALPLFSKTPDDEKALSGVHSHLKSTPHITATDICTFRLYAPFCGMEEFYVSCTATNNVYRYSLKTNTIDIVER